MVRETRKHVIGPSEPASDAGFREPEATMLCTQGVRGSNPLVSTKLNEAFCARPCI